MIGSCLFLLSFGLLSILSMPLSAGAWLTGRRARRRGGRADPARNLALAGEMLGAIGTIFGCLVLTGCAVILAG